MATLYYESSFAHHGIKGQKWGVRRFQNPDGTLTKAGKTHKKNSDFFKDQKFSYKSRLEYVEDIANDEYKKKAGDGMRESVKRLSSFKKLKERTDMNVYEQYLGSNNRINDLALDELPRYSKWLDQQSAMSNNYYSEIANSIKRTADYISNKQYSKALDESGYYESLADRYQRGDESDVRINYKNRKRSYGL